MDAVLFIGLQAAGKTTLFHSRFGSTHVRISLDDLKTRTQEVAALHRAIQQRNSFVIDNTNPTILERKKYIELAKAAGYSIIAYYFEPDIQGSLRRNAKRSVTERVPVPGLFRTRKRLEVPSTSEGFDDLFTVRATENEQFDIVPGIQVDTLEASARTGIDPGQS